MKKAYFLSLLVLIYPTFSEAKDLGSYGHTFVIQEEDLEKILKNRAQKWVNSPAYEKFKQKTQEQVRRRVENPLSGKVLPRTKARRVFYYDPTLEVKEAIFDDQGRIIAPKGKKINPFDSIKLSKKLIFLDGNDREQVSWLRQFKGKSKESIKIILVAGAPLKLSDELKEPVFFDQAGYLSHKLGIQQVPVVVSQEDKKLKIEEIVI